MSAIWGAIDLNGKEISQNLKIILRKAYDKYVIDRYEEKSIENVYMGCGIQYFTEEAIHEPLPIMEKNHYFTADVVLDNRENLAENIGINLDKEMADGELLYKVYTSKGKTSLNDLLGAYCFVWYDKEKNEVELVSDAVGNRCLYYYFKNGILYFSTLLLPLAKISGETLNDRWLIDFLAMDYLSMINEAEETPFKDIYRIAPAQYIQITKEKIEKQQYWNPHKANKRRKKLSDHEYKKQFQELWEQVVKCTIRTSSNVSILLSGGLDSTAVAAIAAPYLKSQGKKLYSYTSVPHKEYKADNSGYHIEDESEDVRKTANFFGNIVPEFVDLDGQNAWDMHKTEMEGLEMPYKATQNLLWIAESMRKAYQNSSRLMLYGSYGNTTISYTELNLFMNVLLSKRKYLTLNKELSLLASNMNFNKKNAWKQIINEYIEQRNYEEPYPYRNSFVNRAYADLLNAPKRLEQIMQNSNQIDGLKTGYRDNVFELLPLRQIGEIATKHSLMTGVLLRDPTKDKRILEFCSSIPLEQFCKHGIDRRLVKEYLYDSMPKHVIRFSKMGQQSADVQFRISKDWERIRKEWLELLEKHPSSKYVDTAYARRQLLEMPDIAKYNNFDVTRYMYTLMVLDFETDHAVKTEPDLQKNTTEEALISVIVPVYNTKAYLQKCVHSIMNQAYKNLEIILVDDGSTDGSNALCDSFCTMDSRIRVIHQENQGVSAARNAALDTANGDYIGFVDSDDWIEPEMYQKLYELITEEEADIACCGYRNIKEGKVIDYSDGRVRIYNAAQMLDTIFTGHDQCRMAPAVWNRLYKRKLFDGIRFENLCKYEDKVINIYLLQHVRKAVFLNKAYYNYVYRTNSLTAAEKNYRDIDDYIKSNHKIIDILKKEMCRKSLEKFSFNYFCSILDNYCTTRKKGKDKRLPDLLKKELRQISNKKLRYAIYQKDVRKKDRLHLWIATYSPQLYYLLLKI